jgi:hypothetical protein
MMLKFLAETAQETYFTGLNGANTTRKEAKTKQAPKVNSNK